MDLVSEQSIQEVQDSLGLAGERRAQADPAWVLLRRGGEARVSPGQHFNASAAKNGAFVCVWFAWLSLPEGFFAGLFQG